MIQLSQLSSAWQTRLQPLADAEAAAAGEVMQWKGLLAERQSQYEAAKRNWADMKTSPVAPGDLVVGGATQNSLGEALTAIRQQLAEAQRKHQLVANAYFGQLSAISGRMQRLSELNEQIGNLETERDAIQAELDAPSAQPTQGDGVRVVINSSGNASEVPAGFNLASVDGLRWATDAEVKQFRALGVVL